MRNEHHFTFDIQLAPPIDLADLHCDCGRELWACERNTLAGCPTKAEVDQGYEAWLDERAARGERI